MAKWNVLQVSSSAVNLPPLHEKVVIELWKEHLSTGKRIRCCAHRLTEKGRKSVFYCPLYEKHVYAYEIFRWSSLVNEAGDAEKESSQDD